MQRIAFKMYLKPGTAAEYQKRHDEIWPELQTLLKESGIREYSIFLDAETHTLFAFQKVEGEQGSQDLAGHPLVQKWWAYMADLMEVHPDNEPISHPLKEVFYLA